MRMWLKKCRESKGYTMKEMATKLDISEGYYCAIENGSRQKKMDLALVAALAVALEISIHAIVQYECEYGGVAAS